VIFTVSITDLDTGDDVLDDIYAFDWARQHCPSFGGFYMEEGTDEDTGDTVYLYEFKFEKESDATFFSLKFGR